MNIAQNTLQALVSIITGDGNISPHRTGLGLVIFFNEDGPNAVYGQGFPSQGQFTQDQLQKLNGKQLLKRVIEDALDPRHYFETDFDVSVAVEHFNKYLSYDGFEVVKNSLHYRVIDKSNKSVITPNFSDKFSARKGGHAFIISV